MTLEDRLLNDWFLTIELSTGCNLKCPTCPQNAANNNLEVMDESLLFDILNGISRDRIKFTSLTPFFRGEPFYNTNFIEYLKLINSFNRDISFFEFMTIHSNGQFINDNTGKKLFELMAKNGYGELIVSLDSSSDELYQKIRPGGDFNCSVNNLKQLINTYKAYSGIITLGIQFVEHKENSDDFPKFLKFWTGILNNNNLPFELIAENEKIMKNVPGIYIVRKPAGEFEQKSTIQSTSIKINHLGCHKAWVSPVIGVKGEITFCCADYNFEMINSNKTYFIQDFDYSIKSFWYSKPMQKIRNAFKAGNFPKKCDTCIEMGLSLENKYEDQ
ncbi:radical SAM protein [bacterium]|nr:radical SAM protein [bacterium]